MKLGARSKQNAALCIIAYRACLRLGWKPSERMLKSAMWGMEHDVTANDFNARGLKR